MKRYLFLLVLAAPLSAAAQHTAKWDDSLKGRRQWQVPRLPYNGHEIVYVENIDLTAPATSQGLYTHAHNWVTNNLRTENSHINYESPAEGTIKGRGEIIYGQQVLLNGAPQSILFNYDINIYDGNYSYRIYDLQAQLPQGRFDYSDMYREEQQPAGAQRWSHQYRYEMLSDMDSFIKLFIAGLKNGIAADN